MEKLEPLSVKKKHLFKNKVKQNSSKEEFSKGFDQGIADAFQEVFNSVNLFKRYEDDVKLLMEEQKPVWKYWVSYYEKKKINQDDYLKQYNTWLFDFVFIKGKKKQEESIFNL